MLDLLAGLWLRLIERRLIIGSVALFALRLHAADAQIKNQPDSPSAKTAVEPAKPPAVELLNIETIQQYRRELLDGVTEITTTGIPGPLCVFGPTAFPVVVDTADKRLTVLVAAADWNRGRVVAFPHPGYLSDSIADEGTVRLLMNCIHWAARKAEQRQQPIRVAVRGYPGILEKLNALHVSCQRLPKENWTAELSHFDVVLLPLENTSAVERQALEKFVTDGGGLISAALIWGWQQGHPGKTPADHPGNQLFASAGLVWADGYAPTNSGKAVAVPKSDLEFAHFGRTLSALEQAIPGSRKLSHQDLEQIDAIIAIGLDAIPEPARRQLTRRISSVIQSDKHRVVPSEKTPLKRGTLERTLAGLRTHFLLQLPVSDLHSVPAATVFPGAVPAQAKRVTRDVTIHSPASGLHSTGLYAAPGDKISVKADTKLPFHGIVLQVGCHSDRLWNLDEWKRLPEIVRRVPLNGSTLEIGNALGGPIYIDLPESTTHRPISLEISNAVEAPHFVHGVTTAAEWRSKLNALPAPWAELETRNVIISVPSDLIRDLTDPDELMEFWARVVDACADLATIPHERKRPERFVFDTQISAGFLHSGYPIMGHINPSAKEVVDLRFLKSKGGWGFYHELGHNHQKADWTFEGTVEVTCNLFSLYVLQTLTPQSYTHDAVQPATEAQAERRYLEGGNFAKWKSDPFVALIMYDQLRKEFGWAPFKKVFAEYRDLPAAKRPKTDDEKRDMWMVMFSHAVHRNLGPFFEHWKIPVSAAARKSIVNLPVWMPPKAT